MLVQLDVFADGRRLADHDTCPVVDEKGIADDRTGVDIDPGQAVGVLRHHPRQKRHALPVEDMCGAVGADRRECRITEDDFVDAPGRRIPLIGGEQVGLKLAFDFRQIPQQGKDSFFRTPRKRDAFQQPRQQCGRFLQADLNGGLPGGKAGEHGVNQ